jgi:hypothetical protein
VDGGHGTTARLLSQFARIDRVVCDGRGERTDETASDPDDPPLGAG